MAIVNVHQKWIYLMEPHTASRAVNDYLMANKMGSKIGHHHIGIPELTDRRRQHITVDISQYKIICTVRNPFDVLVTQWKHSQQKVEFIEWMEKAVNSDTLAATPLMGLWRQCNTFVYYEHLNEDLSTVFGRKIELDRNPAHKTEGKRPWLDYWCQDLKLLDTLYAKYSEFNSMFGYRLTYDTDLGVVMGIDQETREKRCRSISGG